MSTRKALTILAVAVLAACGEDAQKIATGSVSGRALYQGRTDHSGINVTVAGFSTTTSAAGAYSFSDIPTGTQVVIAVAPDSVERTLSTTVSVGGTAADLTFTPAQGLSGMVSAVGGSAAGITVTLDGGRTTTTAADGSYAFSSVSAGTHSLAFASTGYADSITGILFSPDIGAFVPDPVRENAVYRMGPFEMQNGRRLVSSVTVGSYAQLSPDGTLYAYVTPVPGTSSGTLNIAPVAGGAAVAAASNARVNTWFFAPDGLSVVYNADDNGLYAVNITSPAPLAVGAPNKLGDNVSTGTSGWDFSPTATAQGRSTVYFIGDNAVAGNNVRTLFEKVVGTGATLNTFNTADAVSFFRLAKRAARILFFTGGATQRFQSAPSTGAAVTSGIVNLDTLVTSMSIRMLSDDETFVSWTVFGVAVGGVTGFKVAPVTGASATVLIDATTCIAGPAKFSPDNGRVAYLSCAVFPYNVLTRVSNGAAAAVSLGTQDWGSPGFRFSADSQNLTRITGNYPNQSLVLGLAAGGGTPVTVDSGYFFDACFGECDFQVALAPNGSSVAYGRRDVNTSVVTLYQRALPTGAPVVLGTNTRRFEFTPDSAAIVFEQSTSSGTELYLRSTTAGAASLIGARSNTSFGGTALVRYNPARTKFLVQTDFDQVLGRYDTKVVDVATGVVTPLVRKTPFADWAKVGTADKVLTVRKSSPPPYGFQDGVYLTDIP